MLIVLEIDFGWIFVKGLVLYTEEKYFEKMLDISSLLLAISSLSCREFRVRTHIERYLYPKVFRVSTYTTF